MPVEAENKSVDKTTDLSHRQADGGVAVKSSELRAAADLSIQELIDANEKLRVLLGQIHHYGWEFDLKTHHFLFLDKKCRAKACDCMHQFTPEDLVSNGIVHHKSIQNFRLFIRKLLGGEQNGGATLMLRPFKTEGYTWYDTNWYADNAYTTVANATVTADRDRPKASIILAIRIFMKSLLVAICYQIVTVL